MSMQAIVRIVMVTGLLGLMPSPAAHAEWVRGEVRLNLRTGPGPDRKILASIATGDRVTVLEHTEGWTLVRIEDGREGWIPGGFLADEPPPTVRLERTETQLQELQDRLQRTATEAEELRSNNQNLSTTNQTLSTRNQTLDDENRSLKAGVRWPEWITGASILVMGMLLGAILQAWTNRRAYSRIRLD
jgi:SH3 domain protein